MKREKAWWILLVATTATSLFMIDSTIMPIALPTIQRELGFTDVGVMWVMNAYLLALSALLLVGGRLSEIFGFRVLYNVGLIFYIMGSVMCAVTGTAAGLILGRIVQGTGSALTYPATIVLIVTAFPAHMRARGLGFDTGIASFFMMIGPPIGGFLTQMLSWRYILWLNVPMALFGVAMSFLIVRRNPMQKTCFPIGNSLLMVLGIVLLVSGLMQANVWGWSAPSTLMMLLLGPLLLVRFVTRSLRSKVPLVDFNLFKHPLFLATNLMRFFVYILISVTVLWIVYFEREFGYTPLQIGMIILIAMLPVVFMAPLAGWIADRFGYRVPLFWGYASVIFSFLWFMGCSASNTLMIYLPGLLAFGLGLPLVMSPSIAMGLTAVPEEQLGTSTGIMSAVRQLASTIGVAIMTAVYYCVAGSHSHKIAAIAISMIALLCAILGCITALVLVKKEKRKVG